MDKVTRDALDGIAAAEAWKPKAGPIALSDEYLRLIERVERLPESRRRTDKTWTERVLDSWQNAIETAREIHRA